MRGSREMKKIVILLAVFCVALTGALVAPSHAQDDRQARIQAATAYEKTMPVENMINETLGALKTNPQLRAILSEQDFEVMRSSYNIPELRQKLIEAMVKNFTVEEINAMAAFYATPEGRSIMKKIPQYMSDFMPYVQQQSMKIVQEIVANKQKQQGSKGSPQ